MPALRFLKLAPSLLLLFVCTLTQAQSQEPPKGHIEYLGTFSDGSNQMKVAHYTEGKDKAAVIGLTIAEKKVAVAFDLAEYRSFIDLWRRARQAQPNKWEYVGYYKESQTRDKTLLILTAGDPGVQFIVVDPKGTFSFVLSKSDFDRFDSNVRQVENYLAQ